MALPAAMMRGPGTLPALMALRSAIDALYSSPRSRTVVKPANKVRSAYTTRVDGDVRFVQLVIVDLRVLAVFAGEVHVHVEQARQQRAAAQVDDADRPPPAARKPASMAVILPASTTTVWLVLDGVGDAVDDAARRESASRPAPRRPSASQSATQRD